MKENLSTFCGGRPREACARGEDSGSVAVVLRAPLQMSRKKETRKAKTDQVFCDGWVAGGREHEWGTTVILRLPSQLSCTVTG